MKQSEHSTDTPSLVERLREGNVKVMDEDIRTAADEIERLQSALSSKEACIREWVSANAPGGWIDDLRSELERLRNQNDVALRGKVLEEAAKVCEEAATIERGVNFYGHAHALDAAAKRIRALKDHPTQTAPE